MSPDSQFRLASPIATAVATVLAGASLTTITTTARAADKNWVNTQPAANWNNAANWTPGGVPAASDFANIINRTSAFQTVTYDVPVGTSPTLGRLLLNAESTGDLRFVMPADRFATLRTNQTTIGSTDNVTFRQESALHEVTTMFQLGFGGTNGKATYELVGNGTTLNNLGEAFMGGGGRAEFVQMGTAEHHVNLGLYISSLDQNIQNVYQMNGASLTTGQLWVGEFGNGSFSHGAGGVDAGQRLVVAGKANSVGFYDMFQGTSVSATVAEVGREGQGRFNQRGGVANFNQLFLGSTTAATGNYDIGFGTLTTNFTVVGATGRGTLFNDRGLHTTGSMTLGRDQGGNGSYFLAHGATLSVNQGVVVGNSGSAGFNQNGGVATVGGAFVLGDDAVGRGAAGVSFGSLTARTIEVGKAGAGTMNQAGGNVTANLQLVLGQSAGSTGQYTLSGGTLTVKEEYVGANGSGVFTQTGGHHVITDRLSVKHFSTGAGGTFNMAGGSLTAGSLELQGTWNQTGGDARIRDLAFARGQFKVAGGTFTTGFISVSDAMDIAGGTVRLDDGPGRNGLASLTRRLLFSGAVPRLDTTDVGMVLDYATDAPDQVPQVADKIRSGYNGGAWDGPGIVSSQADANHGVGYAPSTALFGPGGAGVFDGITVDATTVVFKLARYGDGNLDGVVNLTDFNALAANFGQSGRGWWQGDFNYDGMVNLVDFNRLAANFGLSASGPGVTAGDWAALGAAVPEPGALGAAFGALALSLHRSRGRRAR